MTNQVDQLKAKYTEAFYSVMESVISELNSEYVPVNGGKSIDKPLTAGLNYSIFLPSHNNDTDEYGANEFLASYTVNVHDVMVLKVMNNFVIKDDVIDSKCNIAIGEKYHNSGFVKYDDPLTGFNYTEDSELTTTKSDEFKKWIKFHLEKLLNDTNENQ